MSGSKNCLSLFVEMKSILDRQKDKNHGKVVTGRLSRFVQGYIERVECRKGCKFQDRNINLGTSFKTKEISRRSSGASPTSQNIDCSDPSSSSRHHVQLIYKILYPIPEAQW